MIKQVLEGGNPSSVELTQMTKSQSITLSGIPIKGNRKTAFESYALYYGGIISCQA